MYVSYSYRRAHYWPWWYFAIYSSWRVESDLWRWHWRSTVAGYQPLLHKAARQKQGILVSKLSGDISKGTQATDSGADSTGHGGTCPPPLLQMAEHGWHRE